MALAHAGEQAGEKGVCGAPALLAEDRPPAVGQDLLAADAVAQGLARNAVRPAISSGFPSLPGGIWAMSFRRPSPRESKRAFGSAMAKAGLLLSRHGPCALPAVFAARSLPIPRDLSSLKRAFPRFHCF